MKINISIKQVLLTALIIFSCATMQAMDNPYSIYLLALDKATRHDTAMRDFLAVSWHALHHKTHEQQVLAGKYREAFHRKFGKYPEDYIKDDKFNMDIIKPIGNMCQFSCFPKQAEIKEAKAELEEANKQLDDALEQLEKLGPVLQQTESQFPGFDAFDGNEKEAKIAARKIIGKKVMHALDAVDSAKMKLVEIIKQANPLIGEAVKAIDDTYNIAVRAYALMPSPPSQPFNAT